MSSGNGVAGPGAGSALARADGPRALQAARDAQPLESVAQVQAQLAAARERAKVQLEALEKQLGGLSALTHWRETVRRHPLATLGGAFLIGYAIARALGRR